MHGAAASPRCALIIPAGRPVQPSCQARRCLHHYAGPPGRPSPAHCSAACACCSSAACSLSCACAMLSSARSALVAPLCCASALCACCAASSAAALLCCLASAAGRGGAAGKGTALAGALTSSAGLGSCAEAPPSFPGSAAPPQVPPHPLTQLARQQRRRAARRRHQPPHGRRRRCGAAGGGGVQVVGHQHLHGGGVRGVLQAPPAVRLAIQHRALRP